MNCQACGPGAAERKMARRLGKERAKKITITRRSGLGKKLGLKKEKEVCCNGMKNFYLKKGLIKLRAADQLLPNRLFFIIEIRSSETNIILSHCPGCGRFIYPMPERRKKNEA